MKKKIYELTLVLTADTAEKELKKLGDELIEKSKGKGLSFSFWGKKDLAYEIKKNSTGVYGFWEIDMPGEGAISLNDKLRINEDILRYLLVSKIIKEEKVAKSKKAK